MRTNFFRIPQAPKEVLSETFKNKWIFPNCIESINGKQVTLQAPVNILTTKDSSTSY